MEPVLYFGVIALLFAAGWYFGHDRTLRRRLNAVPITPIDSVRDGLVRVVGRVHACGRVEHALGTGTSCLAYSVHVTEHVKKGGHASITRFHDSVPFWVEDASGRLRVEAGAKVEIVSESKTPAKDLVCGAELLRMIKARGIRHLTFWQDLRDFHFEEVVLVEGDTVSVLGVAHVELDPTLPPPGPRQIATSIVLGPERADRPVLIGDGAQRFLVPHR